MTISISIAKNQAKILKDYLKHSNSGISHSSCLHAIAKIHGFSDWNTMSAASEEKNNDSDDHLSTMRDVVKISGSALDVLMNGGRDETLSVNCYKILSFMLNDIKKNSVSLRNMKDVITALPMKLSIDEFDRSLDLLLGSGLLLERRGVLFVNPHWFWKGDTDMQNTFLKHLHDSEKSNDGFITNYDYAKQTVERFSSVNLPMDAKIEFDGFGKKTIVVCLYKWLWECDYSIQGSDETIDLEDKKNWLHEDIDNEAEKLFEKTWFQETINSQWLTSENGEGMIDEGYMLEYSIDINHPLMKESIDLVTKRLLRSSA